MKDATSALIRALDFPDFQRVTVEEIRSRSWASATFSGVRHEVCFRLDGEGADIAADAFLNGMEEREFDLAGHILADIALVSRSDANGTEGPLVRIHLQALTIEDA